VLLYYTLGVSVIAYGCLPRLSLCGHVMDRQPPHGVPRRFAMWQLGKAAAPLRP